MVKFEILLNNIEKINAFNHMAMNMPFDIDLLSGRYIIDGKSIMGIFSMNLSKPLQVICHCSKNEVEYFTSKLQPFIVSEISYYEK